MMRNELTYESISANLIAQGKNPADFKIDIYEDGYNVTPLPSYFQRLVAKQEDEPIKLDVNDIGEVLGITLDDTMSMAETVGVLVDIVMNLQARIEELEAK